MKQAFQKTVTSLLLLAVVLTACKKTHVKTKTELLTQTTWKFNKATAMGSDVSSQIPSCFKDNIITFVSNGTGTINESIDICVPPTTGNFTWSFQTNETMINLSLPLLPGGSGSFTIVTLNATNLVISQQMSIQLLPAPLPPTLVTVEITFIH